MRRFAVREAVWIAVLAVFAGWWGTRHVRQWRESGRPQIFYQEYFEPAVMVACGRGFVSGATPAPAVRNFIAQSADSVDCAQVPEAFEVKSGETTYQYAWYYLMWTVGLFWKIFGVSWSGLTMLFGILFALAVTLAYATFRVAVPPWAAAPSATALVFSALHLQNLPHLRDYAKAPFVIGLLLILFWIVRGGGLRRLLTLSALYGLVLGIGYGFRTDFLANIPPFIVAVILFAPGYDWRSLAGKAAAVALGLVIFAGVSRPVINYVVAQGGCQWHVVLLGLEHNFNANLGVTPSYYQWISRYSDEYVHTSVNSFLARTAAARPVPFCVPEYDAASAAYLRTITTNFPADNLTRAYASALRVADLPFHLWGTDRSIYSQHSRIGQVLTNFVGTARLAVVLSILALGATSWRLGLFAVFVAMYFGGYPMLQFAHRHYFHLEFLGWWGLAFGLFAVVRIAQFAAGRGEAPWGPSLPLFLGRAARFGAVVLALILLPLPLLRAFQDSNVHQLTAALLDAPRLPVVMTPDAAGLAVDRAVLLGEAGDATQTVYLDVKLNLQACPDGVALGVRYDKSDPFHDYSTIITPQPPGTRPERVLLAVFRGFEGLSLGGASPDCVSSVERLASVKRLPLLPTLTLPAGWRELPAHQSIGQLAWRLWGLGR